jgi:hypothetical protein
MKVAESARVHLGTHHRAGARFSFRTSISFSFKLVSQFFINSQHRVHLKRKDKVEPTTLAQMVTLLTCIREILGSNLTEDFHGFPQHFQ